MDFINVLPRNENKEVIMVIIDKFTKFDYFIPLTHPYTTIEVTRVFLKNIYKLHELPIKIITDRDSIFISLFWKELMGKLEVKLNISNAYHSQIDGQSKRLNQCLSNILGV
jgi:hypothetical protein